MKFILLFLISNLTYARFDISYDVLDCNLDRTSCEVRVEFLVDEEDFLYINSCSDIDPNSDSLQYCIDDLEVRASRVYNNQ